MAQCSEATVALRLPAQSLYLSVARAAAKSFASLLPFTDGERGAVELAVGEACDNAVRYSDDDAEHFEMLLCVADEHLVIDICNTGGGFLPDGPAVMPDAFAEHGRGLALMECLMDEVEYLPEKDRTTVRMRKRLP